MKRHRHTPEQIVRKFREGDRMLNEGTDLAEVLRQLEVSDSTWNRWRAQYGGMKANEAKRLRELESENARLEKLLAERELGGVLLQQLGAQHLDRFYAAKLAGGRLDGSKGLSVKTVRNIHALMHKALRDAERKQLVSRNVAANADPPKQTHRSFDKTQTWSAEQVMTFLTAMSSHRLYAAYLLAVTTGMRRGEILGLRWQDLDFDSRKLAVRQTVVSVAYEIQLSAPKTAKGRRSIPLDAGTLTELAAHRRSQDRERKLVGIGYADNDLVFAREDGRPIHPDLFSQIFDRTVAKLDVPRIRFHDLRHTHATLGLAAGVSPKVMSGRLGHATVAFTQDVYVHAMPEREQEAADIVAALITGTDGQA